MMALPLAAPTHAILFGTAKMTKALLDHLAHRRNIAGMGNASYRFQQSTMAAKNRIEVTETQNQWRC